MEFGEDVFIDLLGYRKYGHNEGDEPRFTQPQLYKAIGNHKNPKQIYAEKLISEGVISEDYLKKIEIEYSSSLESELEDSKKNMVVMGRNTQLSIEDSNGLQIAVYKVPDGSKFNDNTF